MPSRSVVTSETEEVIVRGDLQTGEAAGDPAEETPAAGMDFTAAIVVAQDEIDRHGPETNPGSSLPQLTACLLHSRRPSKLPMSSSCCQL